MRILRWMILGGAAILATAPATAQTYNYGGPVCLQKWQWGGSYYFDCSFSSWNQCQASAVGLAAMCTENPYFARAQARVTSRRPR
jgi:uncharacterized protein DUF3551